MDSPPSFSDSDDESTCSSCSSSSSVESTPKPVSQTDLGKRMVFTSAQDKKQRYGVLRFVGEPEFSDGTWCGVVLDQPQGKNNGSVHGIRYFTCEPNYGVFVPIDKVEVDTTTRRSRSRPNSQPGSRAASVERKGQGSRPSSASKPQHSQDYSTSSSSTASSVSLGPSSKIGLSMQQDLVNRLSQPMKRHAQSHSQSSQNTAMSVSRRLPMKAFATKGVDEIAVKENKKPLMPFRPGGMYKASSSENLRSIKGKDKVVSHTSPSHKMSQGMPVKKSSSERDLRNTGKSTTSTKPINSATLKPKKKPVRNNSCSNILAPPVNVQTSKSDNSSASRKISCDYTWPRTSTPGNRNELTPDGCSSPEETDDSLLKKTSKLNGFVDAPIEHHPMTNGGTTGVLQDELSHRSAQSPERMHSKTNYSSKMPGPAATLLHPLTTALVTDGAQLLEQLLGTRTTVRTTHSLRGYQLMLLLLLLCCCCYCCVVGRSVC